MSEITIDLEHTLYMSGILTNEELSSDTVCAWILDSYTKQKEKIKEEIDQSKGIIEIIESEAYLKEGYEDFSDFCNMSEEELSEFVSDMETEIAENMNKRPQITLIINSPGGEYDHLVQIYDTMQLLDASIRTIVNGSAFSAGALLAIAGTCGERYITPSSRFMFHAVSIGMEGKAQEIKVDYKEAERLNQQMHKLIMNHTGLSEEDAMKYIDRDIYITPEEAISLGMVDHIVTKIK